jgi:hypothetical protein
MEIGFFGSKKRRREESGDHCDANDEKNATQYELNSGGGGCSARHEGCEKKS